jgi:hypothetical protein
LIVAPGILSFEVAVGATSLLGFNWGFSSAGRAPALQAGGRRFDPDKLHHSWWFGRPFLIAFAIRGAKQWFRLLRKTLSFGEIHKLRMASALRLF